MSGIATGSIYGLIALGFLVVYHATGLVNFAQGQILMVGAMAIFMFVMQLRLDYWVAIIAVLGVALLLALVLRFGVHVPLVRRNAPSHDMVVATIAFGLVLTEVVALTIGNARYGVDPIVTGAPLAVGGITIQIQSLIIVVVAWALVGGIWIFFNKTLTGISLRAVGLNRTAAAVSGVRVGRLITIGFIISVVVTVVAGMLVAPVTSATAHMGMELAVKGFAAAVLGGMSSVYRGMVAGVAIGLIEVLSSYYISGAWSGLIAFTVLFVALVLMPSKVRMSGAHA
ncbi:MULTISPECIES: branched-chain amino acid ABC transporter permease [unclassified Salinibacterium]|uniref:branched-chain amino acid ABC transporter permease n=1 Tax=unclassified Salinibacterium TaxID=2632331 RepID=UPI001423F135|nr:MULTISPECIES: branched-chain amino acid ABC transporter permease [unclassified Salinibacterium]